MKDKFPNISEYVDLTAQLLHLNIASEADGVKENFTRIAQIAQLVTEFPLPDEIEAAPVFAP